MVLKSNAGRYYGADYAHQSGEQRGMNPLDGEAGIRSLSLSIHGFFQSDAGRKDCTRIASNDSRFSQTSRVRRTSLFVQNDVYTTPPTTHAGVYQ